MTARDATPMVVNPGSETMLREAYEKHDVRDIVASIRHGCSVVWREFLKGLENAPSLH